MRRMFQYLLVCLCVLAGTCAADAARAQGLDPTTLVVVGGGLAAGYADSTLSEPGQKASFPVLLARQMGTIMPLPKFRDGGSVPVVTFNPFPGTAPAPNQSTLRGLPFPLFTLNLSVPFLRVAESLSLKPSLPLVVEEDARRTLLNLTIGYPSLIFPDVKPWTQAEYAEFMAPTFAIVEMGFGDAAEGALSGDSGRITAPAAFARDYSSLISRLSRTFATLLLMNVPDPMDTAAFLTVPEAALLYKLDPASFAARLGIPLTDWIRLGGLVEAGDIFEGRRRPPLSAQSRVDAATAGAVRDAVKAYNAAISSLASSRGLRVFDLAAFYREIRSGGLRAGTRQVGGGYMQGFYSSDGMFPTPLGQVALANRLIEFINSSYGTHYALLDLEQIPGGAPSDPDTTPLHADLEVVR